MSKVKQCCRGRLLKLTVMACMVSLAVAGAASASGSTTSTITTAFTTGFTSMASDAVGMIAVIVPIALGVAGTVFLVKKAMGWFKSLAK